MWHWHDTISPAWILNFFDAHQCYLSVLRYAKHFGRVYNLAYSIPNLYLTKQKRRQYVSNRFVMLLLWLWRKKTKGLGAMVLGKRTVTHKDWSYRRFLMKDFYQPVTSAMLSFQITWSVTVNAGFKLVSKNALMKHFISLL